MADRDKRQGWIRDLTPGDVVGVDFGVRVAPATVLRITPTGQVVVQVGHGLEQRHGPDGWGIGQGPFRSRVVEWTPEADRRYRGRVIANTIQRDANRVSYDAAMLVHARRPHVSDDDLATLERIRDEVAAAVEALDDIRRRTA